MMHDRKHLIAEGATAFSKEAVEAFLMKVDSLLDSGYKGNKHLDRLLYRNSFGSISVYEDKGYNETMGMLSTLLSVKMNTMQKKKALTTAFGLAMTKKLE